MKLVKHIKLYFSEGKSDKVYEVDICENQDLFVVNFRYGRRGTNLREGTKTVFPVSYIEALKIYNKLVESKEKKGYSENPLEIKSTKTSVNTIREKTILKYLQQSLDKTYTRNWKVSKIILRAGNLGILSAANLVAKFLESKDSFEQHNAILVLASFKNTSFSAQILSIFKAQRFNTISGRAACAYLLKFGTKSDKKNIKDEVSLLITEDIVNALPMHLLSDHNKNASLLYYAYIFSFEDDFLRNKVLQIIEKIPFKVNTFKSIRYIYRASEITDDITSFALLSKRMALNKPGYTSDYVNDSNGNWITAAEEKKKKNPSIAFSKKTKSYFNNATYKKMYVLSEKDADSYINYATEMLCSLNDKEDNVTDIKEHFYNYNWSTESYENETRCFPKYHNFTGLMYVLYGASSRFSKQKEKWYYVEEATKKREEILPNIWNEKPNEVLQILVASKSDVAIEFALRILNDNLSFLDSISNKFLSKLVGHYHPKVLALIADFLEEKYAFIQPEESVLLSILGAKNDKILQLGLGWLDKYSYKYFEKPEFLVNLLFTNQILVIDYLQKLYEYKTSYDFEININKIAPLFVHPNPFSIDFLVAVNNLIGNPYFGKMLSTTPSTKIAELSNSKLISNKLFAINLAKYNTTPAYELFKDSFDDYVNSDEVLLRKAGIEILAHFPDDFLLKSNQQIVSFCFSEYTEVREAIKPTIERLVKLDASFKQHLFTKLVQNLTEVEGYEGLHNDSYQLLIMFFKDSLDSLLNEQIFSLVLSKYEFAQNLGTPLFEKQIQLENLTMQQLVKLANSDVFFIRQKIQVYFTKNSAQVNSQLEQALLIFNCDWQDVIDWAIFYFDAHIHPQNWTIDLLLYVCDNVKKAVQIFGMKMITKHFSDEKGLPLLEKLQEHPTKEIQFFVTNYLDSYAKDNVKVILKLEGYFKTTLFYINSNRVTKTRVYSFLEQESLKNEKVAEMTIGIINSILDTKVITDKSRNIDILLSIAAKFPKLNVPLTIKEVSNEV